jgi:hypothetical protein
MGLKNSVHLICGMGDTDQDIQKVAQKIRDMVCQIARNEARVRRQIRETT